MTRWIWVMFRVSPGFTDVHLCSAGSKNEQRSFTSAPTVWGSGWRASPDPRPDLNRWRRRTPGRTTAQTHRGTKSSADEHDETQTVWKHLISHCEPLSATRGRCMWQNLQDTLFKWVCVQCFLHKHISAFRSILLHISFHIVGFLMERYVCVWTQNCSVMYTFTVKLNQSPGYRLSVTHRLWDSW